MTDPFDQFWDWREKPSGSRLAIPSELYSAVVSLPETERLSREAVNAAVEHWTELRRSGRTVWTYLNDYDNSNQRRIGEPDQIKLFGSGDAVDRWFEAHDPEGVAWEYEIEGGRQDFLWIHLVDEDSRAIGDPDWAKLFASNRVAAKTVEQNAPAGTIWNIPSRSDL